MPNYSIFSSVSQGHTFLQERTFNSKLQHNPLQILLSSPQNHTRPTLTPCENMIIILIFPKNLLSDWVDYTQPFINMNYLIPLTSTLW